MARDSAMAVSFLRMSQAEAPRRIGRYEIVGRLATGGMAEVLLGRLRGPHGFERPVVIKRILPHLALDQVVVDLFLDEARIIANLRHPNLIHVHELGREGKELFLAMEFLEGESLSGLCRRLTLRGEELDLDLAAHVVEEACAGLHAAHEATSTSGRALEIVHRDVSPQNIFVTYSGAVYVIDFGIATTADRISRTEAGTVRGKFEYLAPEQLQSIPLDRRADIFALGIVLFELASGRRLFRRNGPAATMLAIMNEPSPRLSELRPDVPTQLEEICARALAKNRRHRYQTAADMRRELLTFARKRTDEDLAPVLGSLMRSLFADRVREKAEMLQRVGEGAALASLPSAEVDLEVQLPTAEEHPESRATGLSQSVSVPPPRRKRALAISVAGAVLAAGFLLASAQRYGARRATAGGVPTTPQSAPAPSVAPTPQSLDPAASAGSAAPSASASVPTTTSTHRPRPPAPPKRNVYDHL